MNDDLPDLPEPSDMDGARWGYTADDMRNHAIDAYNAGLAAGRKKLLEALVALVEANPLGASYQFVWGQAKAAIDATKEGA